MESDVIDLDQALRLNEPLAAAYYITEFHKKIIGYVAISCWNWFVKLLDFQLIKWLHEYMVVKKSINFKRL